MSIRQMRVKPAELSSKTAYLLGDKGSNSGEDLFADEEHHSLVDQMADKGNNSNDEQGEVTSTSVDQVGVYNLRNSRGNCVFLLFFLCFVKRNDKVHDEKL